MRAILAVGLVGLIFALAATAAPGEEASMAGQQWLSLLDEQKYEESWKQSGSMFRDQVSQAQWMDSLNRARKPLGALVSRTATRVELVTSLRGAPDGEYAIIHFATALQNKSITERLTLVREGGRWLMAAYAIH